MDIHYLPIFFAKHIPIAFLITKLSFIQDPLKWGYPFRKGFFQIPVADFALIYQAMTSTTFDLYRAVAQCMPSTPF